MVVAIVDVEVFVTQSTISSLGVLYCNDKSDGDIDC